jgi:hypothetical protein
MSRTVNFMQFYKIHLNIQLQLCLINKTVSSYEVSITKSWSEFLALQRELPCSAHLITADILTQFTRYVTVRNTNSEASNCIILSPLILLHLSHKTPWPESASELYRPSDSPLSAKLVPTFKDRGCHVASVTDPYGRIIGFPDRSRYFFFQVAPQLYSRG